MSKDRSRIPPQPRLLYKREAAEYCGVSPSHWSKMVRAGAAPAPLTISDNLERWDVKALDRWIDDLGQPVRDSFAGVE